MTEFVHIITGDAFESLRGLEAGSVQCCVTSPPYWGLRDYGVVGQLGLESTPEEYVSRLVGVFRELRRVLADDGTLWLNLGDSYAANRSYQVSDSKHRTHSFGDSNAQRCPPGLKPKDLVGIPWRVAFALQADGWYLRSDIIWAKPNAMPESVTDRPTKAHEYLFLLAKSKRYYYDAKAIAEAGTGRAPGNKGPHKYAAAYAAGDERHRTAGGLERIRAGYARRSRRTVWTFPAQPYPGAHFATFPEALVEPCILAGSREGDTVLDPFCGSGTVGVVTLRHGRCFLGIELNPEYVVMAEQRIGNVTRQAKLPL
jgi:DNA modification methylase